MQYQNANTKSLIKNLEYGTLHIPKAAKCLHADLMHFFFQGRTRMGFGILGFFYLYNFCKSFKEIFALRIRPCHYKGEILQNFQKYELFCNFSFCISSELGIGMQCLFPHNSSY